MDYKLLKQIWSMLAALNLTNIESSMILKPDEVHKILNDIINIQRRTILLVEDCMNEINNNITKRGTQFHG